MNTERAQEKKEHIFAFLWLDSQQINHIEAASLAVLCVSSLLGWVCVAPRSSSETRGKAVNLTWLWESSPFVVCAVAGAAGCGSCVSGTRGSSAVTSLNCYTADGAI